MDVEVLKLFITHSAPSLYKTLDFRKDVATRLKIAALSLMIFHSFSRSVIEGRVTKMTCYAPNMLLLG